LGALSDAQLLTRYLVQRDQIAFEAIVRRHGGMVLGVCRRILGNAHDAEDAFQATFLVLVRKARTIVPRAGLASWLHGVARRTAMKARTGRARWVARGRQAMPQPMAAAGQEDVWMDLRAIVDEELAALTDIYRQAIVLCDLEGKSRKEAAAQLDWAEGTLSGRLARGRRLLAARLTRRGVALSAAGLTVVLAPHVRALQPLAALVASTAQAATLVQAGKMGAVVAPIVELARKVIQTMLANKLKTMSIVMVVTLLGMGALLGFPKVQGNDEPEVPAEGARPAQKQKSRTPPIGGKIYMHRGLEFTAYDLRRKEFLEFAQLDDEHRHNYQADSARLSPDGRFLAFGQAEEGHPPSRIQVHEVNREGPPSELVSMPGKELSSWSWSPDGKRLSFAVWEEGDKKYHPYIVEVATHKKQKVTLPALPAKGPEGWGAGIHAWSPDGLWLVHGRGHFFLVNPATKEVRQVTSETTGFFSGTCRFSPDGKKVLFIGCPKEKEYNLSVIDLLVGKTKVLADLTHRWGFAACWSPDSRRIACSTIEVDEDFKRNGPCRVEIYDAEGKGEPQVLFEEGMELFTLTDWR
jgi:RNA polymerase sigma factor (sigma-70 family)